MSALSGMTLVANRWLPTVPGAPAQRLRRDAADIQERNYRRWMAGRHRLHERPVQLESTDYTYTPQLPSPDVWVISGVGYAHPETIGRIRDFFGP